MKIESGMSKICSYFWIELPYNSNSYLSQFLVTGDYIVPAGTTVAISQFIVHRNPKYWPNPEKFDPDRFLPENCQNRPYYAFIPFSAGPRSCVGKFGIHILENNK